MPELLNNFPSNQEADGTDVQSAPSGETEISENSQIEKGENESNANAEIEEFIKKEKENFNARCAEIKELVNAVSGRDKAALPKTSGETVGNSIILHIVPERKTGSLSGQNLLTVPVSVMRDGAVDKVTAKRAQEVSERKSHYNEASEAEQGTDFDDLHEDNFYHAKDYSDEYADLEFDSEPGKSTGASINAFNGAFSASDGESLALDEYDQGYRYETIDLFAKSELHRHINAFYREQSALLRRISKLESNQKNADAEENISIIVGKIGAVKELCELTIEILASCVYLQTKGKSTRFKRILKSYIDKYNAFCNEYETASGRAVEHLSYEIIDDIMAGKICRPIPTVYYYGNEDEAVYDRRDEDYDRVRRLEEEEAILDREYKRYLDGGLPLHLSDSERKAISKRKNERLSAIKRAAERDVLLVGLRSEYALSALEAKRDILVRSYGLDKRKMLRSIRSIEKKIEKIKRKTGRAVKQERENNARYYLLSAVDPESEKLKKGARRERLDALRSRLDVLLAEREGVNDRLIAFYGGSDSSLKRSKISRKAADVRRKSATATYKNQRKIAKKIDKYRVPSYMKERAYGLLNEKTRAVATAEECHYKLKRLKPIGRAKRELILEIRRSRAAVKRLDKEIRYMLRKLRRNQERYEDNKEWAAVIAFVLFISVLGIAAWLLIGEDVILYFNKLAEQLGGG